MHVDRLYYQYSENKGATIQLIYTFVFAYGKGRFSQEAAHLKTNNRHTLHSVCF